MKSEDNSNEGFIDDFDRDSDVRLRYNFYSKIGLDEFCI